MKDRTDSCPTGKIFRKDFCTQPCVIPVGLKFLMTSLETVIPTERFPLAVLDVIFSELEMTACLF